MAGYQLMVATSPADLTNRRPLASVAGPARSATAALMAVPAAGVHPRGAPV